jgi:integrase
LNVTALALLRQMRKADPDSSFLFPSHGKSGHRDNTKRAWASICRRARITGLRQHDLRHSFASLLVSAGHGLPVIAELLGHSSVNTTARYAHLVDDVARAATNQVGSLLSGLVAKRPKARALKVVRS